MSSSHKTRYLVCLHTQTHNLTTPPSPSPIKSFFSRTLSYFQPKPKTTSISSLCPSCLSIWLISGVSEELATARTLEYRVLFDYHGALTPTAPNFISGMVLFSRDEETVLGKDEEKGKERGEEGKMTLKTKGPRTGGALSEGEALQLRKLEVEWASKNLFTPDPNSAANPSPSTDLHENQLFQDPTSQQLETFWSSLPHLSQEYNLPPVPHSSSSTPRETDATFWKQITDDLEQIADDLEQIADGLDREFEGEEEAQSTPILFSLSQDRFFTIEGLQTSTSSLPSRVWQQRDDGLIHPDAFETSRLDSPLPGLVNSEGFERQSLHVPTILCSDLEKPLPPPPRPDTPRPGAKFDNQVPDRDLPRGQYYKRVL